jgi:hypothetical protein
MCDSGLRLPSTSVQSGLKRSPTANPALVRLLRRGRVVLAMQERGWGCALATVADAAADS